MSDEFGTYENEAVDFDFEGDWEYQPKQPVLAQEDYNFTIKSVERKYNPDKGSIGYQFVFEPYQDQFGNPLTDINQIAAVVKSYFYLGSVQNGKVIESPYANTLKVFLISIDVNPVKNGKWTITNDVVNGIVVKAPVLWEKVLSNQANPKTGQVPTVIDESDPFSYYIATKIDNNKARGVRDELGRVKRVS